MNEILAANSERRFGGIARLYGTVGLARLRAAHVCVVGVGGVGSWAAEALARSAIGRITLIDLDNVAESNVNRQIHAMDGEFGKAKIDVMAERIRAINPDCRITLVEDFISHDNVQELIGTDIDWVMDCIDTFRIKAALLAHCKRNKIKAITVGGAGGVTDPTRIKVIDLSRATQDPLLARTRGRLRDYHGFTRNPKRRFSIPSVHSEEQAVYPTPEGGICAQKPEGAAAGGLSCAGGIGSVMTVTATFGLVAASVVLARLTESEPTP
ncbi:tRNA cyclic N6-threonylcarbamoyladenosine(37) synthase TcdA [Methylococcus sp. EFPC2]|uniref:tRNA cyclic N6-threonylcarbamoyladenosine(37) synthase TcdA n=1 Tax=Methylococcus sp. EFPC2 TaxID=2812648 RepID=UPI00196720B0|nr:tRNA cyclic N6-threonylcarbamoyladenosine(37) synthase TcdA [Methylococcus sp. EFPC2]QSA97980.1 tRNA cyclic N6-threonylcarbamoyladenosine(37) synthase TcdA [Methylococcus sp. EFPC2]